jgi:hypothetical protein
LVEMACVVEHRSGGKGSKELAIHSNSECASVVEARRRVYVG